MEYICIDFGTCNTVISYYENKAQKFVYNPFDGEILIPTIIYFNESEITKNLSVDNFICGKHYFIGSDAHNMYEQTKNDKAYFYQFKRFLGLTKNNVSCNDFLKKFNVDYELDNDTIYFYLPLVVDDVVTRGIKINIVQLISLFFRGLKTLFKVDGGLDVLITCPAYFHDLQRQQLGSAVISAGYSMFKMCNEPTVALMHYFEMRKTANAITPTVNENNDDNTATKQVLVKTNGNGDCGKQSNPSTDGVDDGGANTFIIYDLGGGTLDTTVVENYPDMGLCDVIDIYGDNALGGTDIDNVLVSNIFEKYRIAETAKMKYKIKNIAEKIKIILTTTNTVTFCLEEVLLKDGSVSPMVKIEYTRHEFNRLITHIIDRMIEPIVTMSKKHDTKNIIFIGGPTQIPLITTKLEAIIGFKPHTLNATSSHLYKTIVAMGGSLLFNILKNKTKLTLLDIIPMNIGIAGNDDEMITIIPKNSKFPFSASKIFTTSHDGQRKIDINIYEGISDTIINNSFIGSYTLFGIPPVEKGQIIIELTFQINENGFLNIFIDSKSGHKINDTIKLIPQVVAKKLFQKLLEKVSSESK